MKWSDLFETWNLTGLHISTPLLNADFAPQVADRKAAWELYVEIATRVSSEPLPPAEGVDKAALDSLYGLFGTTREVLRANGPEAGKVGPVAIAVLNQVLRPLLTRWHAPLNAPGGLDPAQSQQFREELEQTRLTMQKYISLLAQIAGV